MKDSRGAAWLPRALHSALRIPNSALGLMGPIFEKELRVSSRRTHTYVARTVYLLALLAFLVAVWGEWVGRLPASPVGRLARMPEAAKAMVVTVVWFQFVASQGLALVMLSTSIGEEVRRRTLGVLITTPITGLQIVGGKLLSRLFQVLLLVAASVPVLLPPPSQTPTGRVRTWL